jgi:hypothetical protein
MKPLGSRLQTLWCKSMHPAPMWPVHGRYQCPVCLRSYPVAWEQPTPLELVLLPEPPVVAPELGTRPAPATAAATSQ